VKKEKELMELKLLEEEIEQKKEEIKQKKEEIKMYEEITRRKGFGKHVNFYFGNDSENKTPIATHNFSSIPIMTPTFSLNSSSLHISQPQPNLLTSPKTISHQMIKTPASAAQYFSEIQEKDQNHGFFTIPPSANNQNKIIKPQKLVSFTEDSIQPSLILPNLPLSSSVGVNTIQTNTIKNRRIVIKCHQSTQTSPSPEPSETEIETEIETETEMEIEKNDSFLNPTTSTSTSPMCELTNNNFGESQNNQINKKHKLNNITNIANSSCQTPLTFDPLFLLVPAYPITNEDYSENIEYSNNNPPPICGNSLRSLTPQSICGEFSTTSTSPFFLPQEYLPSITSFSSANSFSSYYSTEVSRKSRRKAIYRSISPSPYTDPSQL
jgi:hypothetical protein